MSKKCLWSDVEMTSVISRLDVYWMLNLGCEPTYPQCQCLLDVEFRFQTSSRCFLGLKHDTIWLQKNIHCNLTSFFFRMKRATSRHFLEKVIPYGKNKQGNNFSNIYKKKQSHFDLLHCFVQNVFICNIEKC